MRQVPRGVQQGQQHKANALKNVLYLSLQQHKQQPKRDTPDIPKL
jgi:hypothetical protein